MRENPTTRRRFLEQAGAGSLSAVGISALPQSAMEARDRTGSMKITRMEAVTFRKDFHIGGSTLLQQERDRRAVDQGRRAGSEDDPIELPPVSIHWGTVVAQRDRLQPGGNLWRRLVLPKRIDKWSPTSLRQRLVKTGGRLLKHARY